MPYPKHHEKAGKTTKSSWSSFALGLLSLCLLLAAGKLRAQSTTFTFVLDEPSTTSAGVYQPDGTLVRTLWSKVRYATAGTNTAVWDGLNNNSNPVAPGTYEIRVLQHNVQYVWDGAIGNSSAEISGPTVHRGFLPIQDMAIAGTNAFYVSGYNEGMYDFRSFSTADPQHVRMALGPDGQPANANDRTWLATATDGNLVYFACSAANDPVTYTENTSPGFITACNVRDGSLYSFSAGSAINNVYGQTYPNGVSAGTQPGLLGLAVQQNGNLLAVAVGPDNRVYLFDKASGAAISSFPVNSPGRLNFSPDGSLWIISGANSVVCVTNVSSSPGVALTIPGFNEALDVAVNPANAALILVADGGASQQVKAFNNLGNSLWTYGLAGGYQSNGVAVTTNKFYFSNSENDETFLCFAPDGSFWVGDGGNHRSLHFSAALNYLEQIMYQPRSYVAGVDQNNPSRVFNEFLEFKVDYTKPLSQAWTLVNNWGANLDPAHVSLYDEGIYEVTTFTNGRTYALIDNLNYQFGRSELCELDTNYGQLRLTGIFPVYVETGRGWTSFGPDGSARRTTMGIATWYESLLTGFDATNNPVWAPETLMASAPNGATDPVPRPFSFGNVRATVSTNNILIAFDQSLNNGYHLGGIRLGATNWLWEASPAVAFMDGRGTYEISNGVQYGGNTVQTIDRNIVYGYHGEFFRNSGQASQTMHFYDDGLFVGQFGEANNGHSAYEGALPASAGNTHSRTLLKTTNDDYFVWMNDESSHGPQRWHLVNVRNIREQSASGVLGGTITLTNPPCAFPVGVIGWSGNQSAALCWQAVPGASSYNIRYSLINGGPYTVLAGSTIKTNFVAGGLTNGQTCYFVVTAVAGSVEGVPSGQVKIHPFDTSQNVLCAGSISEGGLATPVVEVDTNAPLSGQPSWIGGVHLTGVLALSDLVNYGYGDLQNENVGAGGYYIIDFAGSGTILQDILPPFDIPTYLVGPDYGGWSELANLSRQFTADGTPGVNRGFVANAVGTIPLSVTDTNFHYLTVASPAEFNYTRAYTLSLTSTNGQTAQFVVNESPGLCHTYQFLFRGPVTLTADGTDGAGAIVQAIFLDNASVTYSPTNSTAATPVLKGISLSGCNLVLQGGNGQSGRTCYVLMSPNLATPLNQWIPVATNALTADGNFTLTVTNAWNPICPPEFYRLEVW